jgi:hypothetical protein
VEVGRGKGTKSQAVLAPAAAADFLMVWHSRVMMAKKAVWMVGPHTNAPRFARGKSKSMSMSMRPAEGAQQEGQALVRKKTGCMVDLPFVKRWRMG